ncbi:MAG: methyltransferase domain-containing protein [Gammaproteobacteria bacterium]
MYSTTIGRCMPGLLLLLGSVEPAIGQEAPNRDPHGPPDVQSYIQSLMSDERIADLKPDRVIAALMLPEDAIVADLGCGPGVFTVPLAQVVRKGVVYAVDVEPQQLDALRQRLIEEDLHNVVPVLASFSTPHLPPARLNLVLLVDTYHHIEDRVEYFRRLRTVLRPGGRIAIIEYKPGEPVAGPPIEAELPEGLRQEELQAAGFSLLRGFDIHEHHDFEVWVPSISF